MKTIINFAKGFSATGKTTKMVLLLFLINLFFSLLLAIPMYNSLSNSLSSSKAGERMAEGFDYLWWEEFRDESSELEKTFRPSIIGKGAILNNLEGLIQMRFFQLPSLILIMGLFYIVLHTFLAGGILSIFNQEDPNFSMKRFFEGAGTYFFRFLLLMLLSWVFFLAIAYFLGGGLSSIMDDVRENAISEVTPFYLGLIFSAVIFFFLLFIQMVFDYARIKIVMEESRNALKVAFQAFGFVFKHLFSTFGLYYLIFLFNVAVTVIYIFLKELVPQSAWYGVLTAFFIQQLFIFSLIWIRCLLYSSQMELYRYLR